MPFTGKITFGIIERKIASDYFAGNWKFPIGNGVFTICLSSCVILKQLTIIYIYNKKSFN